MKISGGAFGGGVQHIAPALVSPSTGAAAAAPGFGDVLKGMLSDVDRSLRAAEQNGIGAMTGDVSLQKAVESVVQAEQKVQLTAAVRDKIVAAYLELSRMQI